MPYDHLSIEKKWQKFWEEHNVFHTENPSSDLSFSERESVPESSSQSEDDKIQVKRPKKYILDMFPYPSGAGLHVGHPKGYTATDIVSRYYHAKGFNVLHPMGFDAFGLPAENYAVKTGTHPKITTEANIATFLGQMKALGFSYDWDRMVDTTDPEYYKWTQWIFTQLFKRGLAYEAEMPVNWCPALKVVLANEEVIDGKSEIGGHPVEKKLLRQWVLRITEYADRLITDLDGLDWPEGIKEMQRNWIGKSEGCEFQMMKSVIYPGEKGEGGFSFRPTALILHGWEGKAESNWFPSLKISLEQIGYHVIVPDLPNSDSPDMVEQLDFLKQFTSELDGNSLIIGHSLGGQLAAKYIENLDTKVKALILVAPTYHGVAHYMGIDSNGDITKNQQAFAIYTANEIDFEAISHHTSEVFLHISKDDPYIGFDEVKKYYKSFSNIQIHEYEKKGHFNTSDGITYFPEILEDITESIRVYTTRVDTVYGMTYAVLAPDHPSVEDFIAEEHRKECEEYIKNTKAKTDLDRTNEGKEKTGVFTGSYVVNPYNGESVPLWIADYVLGSYGTGAVMAVPAHDERDFEFAKKYKEEGIKIKCSILTTGSRSDRFLQYVNEGKYNEAYSIDWNNDFGNDGTLWNSGEYSGISSIEARKILSEKAEKEGFGHKKVNYKLRDWLFSRQRYWGEPIPLIHISYEDYMRLPRIEKMKDAKMGEASVLVSSSGVKWNETKDPEFLDASQDQHDESGEYLVIDGKVFSKVYEGLTGKLLIDSRLPLLLPEVEKYEPSGDGQSPLATVPDWVNVKLASNLSGKLETNTMPQWGGSCWYYLRYMDAKNPEALASQDAMYYWQNVDEYVGGAEHAVLHLLYARFWHKVLFDIGVVPTLEPFQKLTNVGMILAYAYERSDGGLVAVDLVEERDGKFFETETGKEVKQVVAKMSKSLKNVVNPNDIVIQYGADTLRLYEMSMSAFTDTAPWNQEAIIGVRRFLDKAYATFLATDSRQQIADSGDKDMKKMKLLHKTVKKVGEDIVDYKFNTAISALMILLNEGVPTDQEFALEWKEKFSILLHPFAPHMAEELYQLRVESGVFPVLKTENGKLKTENSIYFAPWPEYDDFMLIDDEVTIAIQVNGKLRGTLTCLNGVMQEEVSSLAMENPDIAKWILGKILVKEIFIPNKMLSIVVKD